MQANIQVMNSCRLYITTTSPIFHLLTRLLELNEAFFTEKCITLLKENYEYDGVGLAVWDLFGGSNTNVCGSFKDLRYYQNRWYVMSFVYEEYWGDKEDNNTSAMRLISICESSSAKADGSSTNIGKPICSFNQPNQFCLYSIRSRYSRC